MRLPNRVLLSEPGCLQDPVNRGRLKTPCGVTPRAPLLVLPLACVKRGVRKRKMVFLGSAESYSTHGDVQQLCTVA